MDCTHESSLSVTISWSLLKLMSIESAMPSNHPILCCPLLSVRSLNEYNNSQLLGCAFSSVDNTEWWIDGEELAPAAVGGPDRSEIIQAGLSGRASRTFRSRLNLWSTAEFLPIARSLT